MAPPSGRACPQAGKWTTATRGQGSWAGGRPDSDSLPGKAAAPTELCTSPGHAAFPLCALISRRVPGPDLIRGLLQLRPCARLGLQQVAAHCWMLPATHALSGTTLRMPPEKPANLEHSEPGRDSEPPRRRPRHCFWASAWAAEADPRRGAGSAQLGLWSARTASLGVGASR
ncbi:testis-specific serine/threonine-protein kinase 5-like isoform X2 [Neofelis nebulosa]|uniref:testis-specific serine/threonine-protein kinase 5-like isoform X2 n=1 Tax=Neofelis nebulosa TaxID=61452 RepID=UPI002729E9C4|nr:testis-specific serine/threonine-protein kinase 5-like isoform X2 [Neofelis nebulosa]